MVALSFSVFSADAFAGGRDSGGSQVFDSILGNVLDASASVAGYSIAKGLGGNREWQIFGQAMGPSVLGSQGLGGIVFAQMGNNRGGYRQAVYDDYPAYGTHPRSYSNGLKRGYEEDCEPARKAEMIIDQNGNKYLCYDDGCKPIHTIN